MLSGHGDNLGGNWAAINSPELILGLSQSSPYFSRPRCPLVCIWVWRKATNCHALADIKSSYKGGNPDHCPCQRYPIPLLPSLAPISQQSPFCGLCPPLQLPSTARFPPQPGSGTGRAVETRRQNLLPGCFHAARTAGTETCWLLDLSAWPACPGHVTSLRLSWSGGSDSAPATSVSGLKASGA